MSICPGEKYGKLTVVDLVTDGNANKRKWLCKCECGGVKITSEDNLKRSHCKSCGCLYSKIGGKSKHGTERGESKTRLYKIWSRMVWRCERPSYKFYKDYGGRGITVCPDWHSFKRFKEWANDNGYSDGLSLDRIDNNMGYSPNNCRWATPKQQANNRRDNVKIEYQGEKRTIAEWADRFGFNYTRFYQALKRGYTIDRYIEKEAHNRGNLHT